MARKFLLFALLITLMLAACRKELRFEFKDLPEGDAASGEKLFQQTINGAPSCASCHSLAHTALVGPGLVGYGERAAQQVKGESAEEYTFNSIARPAKHVVSGFSNLMYSEYIEKLSPEDVADLIAYLLTL